MPEVITIEDFIASPSFAEVVIFDVRSPGEYEKAHIPGALNLPLLNNEERAVVGTIYKQQGHEEAVLKGFDLVGAKFGDYIRKANEICKGKEAVLYCWRGGMRSNIIAWLLEKSGFKITLIRGGYKSYRRWALKQLESEKNIVMIGGMTGSGKTDLLIELANQGEQVIDLEAIASHKGSAFGGLGQKPQPGIEQFENQLAFRWHKLDRNKITWIENESRSIGTVILSACIYEMMLAAPMIEVLLNKGKRISRILNEYGNFPKDVLAATTKKLEKRLGGHRLKEALNHLEAGEMNEWAMIMLDYYDKLYRLGIESRTFKTIHTIELNMDDMKADALKISELEKRINFTAVKKIPG